jgi:hypothetical protein
LLKDILKPKGDFAEKGSRLVAVTVHLVEHDAGEQRLGAASPPVHSGWLCSLHVKR